VDHLQFLWYVLLKVLSAEPRDLALKFPLLADTILTRMTEQGVSRFTAEDWTKAGYLNTTFERIRQVRDNEAGHLRIFQVQISSNSIKPGACKYQYPYDDPLSWIALQTLIETASMAFITGLGTYSLIHCWRPSLTSCLQSCRRNCQSPKQHSLRLPQQKVVTTPGP
jgi:hypothetical protein